jgi:hypothetical protein
MRWVVFGFALVTLQVAAFIGRGPFIASAYYWREIVWWATAVVVLESYAAYRGRRV